MNTLFLKDKTFMLSSTHIYMRVLFHMLYYIVEKERHVRLHTSTTAWSRSLLVWDAVWHRLVVGYGSSSSSSNQDIFLHQ